MFIFHAVFFNCGNMFKFMTHNYDKEVEITLHGLYLHLNNLPETDTAPVCSGVYVLNISSIYFANTFYDDFVLKKAFFGKFTIVHLCKSYNLDY